MPTPEEIKKIAREYAENVKSEYVSAKLIETLVMGFYHSRLKTDYCIVEKSKVIGLWNEINNDAKINIENGFPDYAEFNKLQLTPIEILFGTELFNEEKE